MAGLYSRNHLFEYRYNNGMEKLPTLQDEVSSDEIVKMNVLEKYETILEDDWPDFIRDFYIE